ncbi:hypothetical protein AAY473_009595, partial [Plecturocebus cupreus]
MKQEKKKNSHHGKMPNIYFAQTAASSTERTRAEKFQYKLSFAVLYASGNQNTWQASTRKRISETGGQEPVKGRASEPGFSALMGALYRQIPTEFLRTKITCYPFFVSAKYPTHGRCLTEALYSQCQPKQFAWSQMGSLAKVRKGLQYQSLASESDIRGLSKSDAEIKEKPTWRRDLCKGAGFKGRNKRTEQVQKLRLGCRVRVGGNCALENIPKAISRGIRAHVYDPVCSAKFTTNRLIRAFSMLVRLVSNSQPQVIRPPRPPKVLGLQ